MASFLGYAIFVGIVAWAVFRAKWDSDGQQW